MAEAKFVKGRCASFIMLILWFLCVSHVQANPWLPEPGGWKYNLQYSKYATPKSIKFYERDLYFALEREQILLKNNLAQYKISLKDEIDQRESALLILHQNQLNGLNVLDKQNAKDRIFKDNLDLQILYNRINNQIKDAEQYIQQLKNDQQKLITAYHKWSASSSVEYGLDKHISYGISGTRIKEVNKLDTNKQVDNFSIFFKGKLYGKKGYALTLQPKFLTLGDMQGADFTLMLGKSHIMKRKVFGKEVEVFGYSAFGVTRFLNTNMSQTHAEVTSGIKWNDSTILMNQESEDFNPGFPKTYKRVVRSQFTIAQDLNFASIEPRNKVYLTFSYFSVDSVKANRNLSTGYSIGLWLEL